MWNGAVVDSSGDQAGIVCHVDKQKCTDIVCDLPEFFVRDLARVSTRSGNDHLWFVLFGQSRDLVEVDTMVIFLDPVVDEVVKLA